MPHQSPLIEKGTNTCFIEKAAGHGGRKVVRNCLPQSITARHQETDTASQHLPDASSMQVIGLAFLRLSVSACSEYEMGKSTEVQ